MIDDKKYWLDRHQARKGEMAAVGQKDYSEEANYYIYRILKERYSHLLQKLDVAKGVKILDAGSGIGVFSRFMVEEGFKVVAADISMAALEALDGDEIETICTSIDQINLPKESFEIVQCFDVLYHILDDEVWRNSIRKMCDLSKKYVILHERFLRNRQLITAKHVKMRTYSETVAVLNEAGFKECSSTPTHFLAMRLLTYRFSRFFPKTFYWIDRFILNLLDQMNVNFLGSHHIKVFERMR